MPNDLNLSRPDEGHGDCVKSKNVALNISRILIKEKVCQIFM